MDNIGYAIAAALIALSAVLAIASARPEQAERDERVPGIAAATEPPPVPAPVSVAPPSRTATVSVAEQDDPLAFALELHIDGVAEVVAEPRRNRLWSGLRLAGTIAAIGTLIASVVVAMGWGIVLLFQRFAGSGN